MIYKRVKCKARIEIQLNERTYIKFVGSFHSCTGNNDVNEEQLTELLNKIMSWGEIGTGSYKFKLTEAEYLTRRIIAHIDLEVRDQFEFCNEAKEFESHIWRNLADGIELANIATQRSIYLKELEYYDEVNDIELEDTRYIVLTQDMKSYFDSEKIWPLDRVMAYRYWEEIEETDEFLEFKEYNPNGTLEEFLKEEDIDYLEGYSTISYDMAIKIKNNASKQYDVYEVVAGGGHYSYPKYSIIKYEVVKIVKKLEV